MRNVLIVILYIAVLYCAWYVARNVLRRHRSGPNKLTDADYHKLAEIQKEGIGRELAKRDLDAREYQERQRTAYKRRWVSTWPKLKGDAPPEEFDRSVAEHATFALSIVGDYDAAREQAGAFTDCLYRPASDLPYPREAIRACCEFLIGIADGETPSPNRDQTFIADERDALGFALFSLDFFLDLPASEIPRQKMQNLAFVKRQYLAGSKPPVKPRPGDHIIIKNSQEPERVEQLIGLDHDDHWMVLASSGSPMQIVYNAELSRWEEMPVIAPAITTWLKLTDEQPALDLSGSAAWANARYRGPA